VAHSKNISEGVISFCGYISAFKSFGRFNLDLTKVKTLFKKYSSKSEIHKNIKKSNNTVHGSITVISHKI